MIRIPLKLALAEVQVPSSVRIVNIADMLRKKVDWASDLTRARFNWLIDRRKGERDFREVQSFD
jgi:hypothetical protein